MPCSHTSSENPGSSEPRHAGYRIHTDKGSLPCALSTSCGQGVSGHQSQRLQQGVELACFLRGLLMTAEPKGFPVPGR